MHLRKSVSSQLRAGGRDPRAARDRRLLPQGRQRNHRPDGPRDSGRGDRAEAGL